MTTTSVEAVWDTFNTPLARFIRKRVPDRQAADDLLQDVYIKMHTNLDGLRDNGRLRAWVYQIARNAVYDYYRSLKPAVPLLEDVPQPAADDATDEIAERLSRSVREMVAALPEPYREALILTEFHGLTQKQLAEQLGISVSGAKSRVQRGRKLLREMLFACCHFQFDRLGKVIDYHPHCHCCAERDC
ncbi:MAG: RNA polymerase sigma factor SigZ [Anaerolineae bacterium]|nr:RNA polymerase sigma factor SigZ [Anaerolineae bacterium]